MRLKVVQNYFAPKYTVTENAKIVNSHMVVLPNCNFKCGFCDFWNNKEIEFKDITREDYDLIVRYLSNYGRSFKFTGGEPCLNTHIEYLLKKVKDYNGFNYLDSNGSKTNVLLNLAEKDLIDVLGISLKGLTKNEAIIRSGNKSVQFAWENPLTSISEVTKRFEKIVLLVTYVFINNFEFNNLLKFADILESLSDRVILKMNNLIHNKRSRSFSRIQPGVLSEAAKFLTIKRPIWKGRIVLIENEHAITQNNEIQFF